MITINGQDGGGQLLRSSLSLALMTGQAFRMHHIRGRRKKPGLMRQHLACVQAALMVGDGSADGAELGSEELIFHPGTPRAGEYHIQIGGAGSTVLVAQTLLPTLLTLDAPSRLVIEGGTHNPMAPSYDFFSRAFLPALRVMGYAVEARLKQAGFVPAGGGQIEVDVQPRTATQPFVQADAVEYVTTRATIYHYQLSQVAEKISALLAKSTQREGGIDVEIQQCPEAACNGLSVRLESTDLTGQNRIITDSLAEYGLRSESLVKRLLRNHRNRCATGAPVCNRLADQLMLYLAPCPTSTLTTGPITNHLRTNTEVINAFLPGAITLTDLPRGLVEVT